MDVSLFLSRSSKTRTGLLQRKTAAWFSIPVCARRVHVYISGMMMMESMQGT